MHSADILEIKVTGLVFTSLPPYILSKIMQVAKNNLIMMYYSAKKKGTLPFL